MFLEICMILAGLALLIIFADKFVEGAASIAHHHNVPIVVIGFIIVGLGTSLPEMFVAASSSLDGVPSLAVGNALGSNIANIALILSVTALISPIAISQHSLKFQVPLLLGATVIAGTVLHDGKLSFWEGFSLISAMSFVLFALSYVIPKLQANADAVQDIMNDSGLDIPEEFSQTSSWMNLILGGIFLFVGSKLLVTGSTDVALEFGIEESIIGLTIIAIGTSLPELSASVAAAVKGKHDLIIGNVLGSNVFNTLMVLGIPGLLVPAQALPDSIMSRDLPWMVGITLLLVGIGFFCYKRGTKLNRSWAMLLGALFVTYMSILAIDVLNTGAAA
ncbi:calcium/sodium antiporter [Neptuniibacter sp. QD37_11]|uniref:calcium/sodium antiporter n=1 Tax=Neptuniibacter sp. QD37_11 TaxID=3398209 RepID=UPI0039F4BE88